MKAILPVLIAVAFLLLAYLSGRVAFYTFGCNLHVFTWWADRLVWHGTMLLTVLVIIAVISKGRFSRFGFRLCHKSYLWKSVFYAIPLFILSELVGDLFSSLSTSLFCSVYAGHLDLLELSLRISLVHLLGPILEEVAFRGLVQTYLSSRIPFSFSFSFLRFRLSHANLVTTILFGFSHLQRLSMGFGIAQMLKLELSVLVLGLSAGHFREKSESLIPGLIIHLLFNIMTFFSIPRGA